MDNKEWSDIIVKCAEDYTKLKSTYKVETPPRDFIRAWMQINYSIFKLSGHFFRMFNAVLKKKYDEGTISESFVRKISKTSKESILDNGFIGISEKDVNKLIDTHQESFDKWAKHPKSLKEGHPNVRINKGEKRPVFFGTLEDKIGCYKNIFDEVRDLFLDKCCEFCHGKEISLKEILDSTDSYVFLRAITLFKGLDGEEPVVEFECMTQYGTDFVNKYRIGLCVGTPVNFSCYWSQLSTKAKMEIMMTFKTELEGIEESSVVFKTKRKNLDESFTKKTSSKKTIQDMIKRANDSFLYHIGDVFPKEGEEMQGIVVADSESLKRNGILIMTPTFIDAQGKPTSNKGFRTKNSVIKAIELYNKRNGGGWHLLTRDEGLAMGLMENVWELSWEKQEEVFYNYRDKIISTLERLGYSGEEIYGTNMLIMAYKSHFNIGGWYIDNLSYSPGNMLRLFKFIDFENLSESFTKKISGKKSGTLISKANELATDIEDIETFVKFLDNYFSENAEDLKAKAKPKELIFNYFYKYKNESRADDWKRHLFEFSFDTIKRKISKKTGNVEKEFISRFTIYICNSMRYKDSFVFEVDCERPWSFQNPSMDSRYESFYFVGQSEVNDPRHERFIIPFTISKASMIWKPTLRNAILFRDMILMIIDNFSEIGKMKDLYPNAKIANAYQESFNEIKDNVYNVSPTSIYR